MIRVDVVPLPRNLHPHQVDQRAVVVFDVLRATTTICYALAAGAREVRAFDSLETAQREASQFAGEKILCGERKAVRPSGFDLGNSPAEFSHDRVAGKTLFMSTTNGTRAIVAARDAKKLFAAALVNANATAKFLETLKLDVILLCAGTDGAFSDEDMIGAGAVLDALQGFTEINLGAETTHALQLFHDSRHDLAAALRNTQGGRNCIAAGLGADIEATAKLDLFDVVIEIEGQPPIARKRQ